MKYVKTDGNLIIVHLYNPCKSLSIEALENIINRHGNGREIWCREFHAHNSLWGSMVSILTITER